MGITRKRITLVLGAGASWTYGYPTGLELTKLIIDLDAPANSKTAEDAGLHLIPGQLSKFVHELRHSQMNSIDAFLARRPEFAQIGKQAIATVLIGCEREGLLLSPRSEDHWYRYLLNVVTVDRWADVDFSSLKVVTFNYDRSLEHYLLISLMSAYTVEAADVLEKLKTLKIVHCYGSLGRTLPDGNDYFPYGDEISVRRVTEVAESIQVLAEGRDNSDRFDEAQMYLSRAHSIIFLGFGFDKLNLQRLNAAETCTGKQRQGSGVKFRKVAATCFQLTTAEIARARLATVGPESDALVFQKPGGATMIDPFQDTHCTNLLRETLLLED